MRHSKKAPVFLLTLMLVAPMLTPCVMANAAEPPSLTIIVTMPPKDLALSIRFVDGSTRSLVELQKTQKGWETYYRFYTSMLDSSELYMDSAALIVDAGATGYELVFPRSGYYSNVYTLDLRNGELIQGQTTTRLLLLAIMRVALTLLIEALVFVSDGFRAKRSWIVFITVNLLTQLALNYFLSGPNLSSYWYVGYIIYEIIIMVTEMTAFAFLIMEQTKGKAVALAVKANTASLVIGGLALAFLPI